jgi:hypothetical protein
MVSPVMRYVPAEIDSMIGGSYRPTERRNESASARSDDVLESKL